MKQAMNQTMIVNRLKLWLTPLLLASFPTLVIYSHNLDQLELVRTAVPLLYSLGFVGVSGLVALAIFKSHRQASLFTSLWVVLFFSYGYFYLKLGEVALIQSLPVGLNLMLLGAYAVILIGVGWLLSHRPLPKKLADLPKVIAITLLLLNAWLIVPFVWQRFQASKQLGQYLADNPVVGQELVEPTVKPDIFYVVFDRYARQDVLAEQFDFDNEPTLRQLETAGFLVGRQSFANYPNTFLSLSSSLNMRYLDFLPELLGPTHYDRVSVYQRLIQNNEVARLLKSQGYQYVLAGSFWDPSKTSPIADQNHNLFKNFDEFQLYIYERTLWNTLRGLIENRQLYTGVELLERMSQNLDFRLNGLKKQVNDDQPQFVLAHFLLPHEPRVFTADCLPMEFDEIRKLTDEQGFLLETACANTIINELTTYIQDRVTRPTIIIFQADEGPYLPAEYFDINEEIVPDDLLAYHIHTAILNAIYLPNKENPNQPANYQQLGLDESFSPVNTFRVIFNYYFGTELPILDNRSYLFTGTQEPYNFKEITPVLN